MSEVHFDSIASESRRQLRLNCHPKGIYKNDPGADLDKNNGEQDGGAS